MGMSIGRGADLRQGTSVAQDMISVNNSQEKSPDGHIEKMRQKIGSEFTADRKRDIGKKKNEMGKDDFMKLMSAQLKYQDPISPMKNEQMAAQLAQFSALEQMMNVNQNLEKMAAGQKPSEHMIAASLIGKRVTTDSARFMLEKGSNPDIAFKLPEDAASVNVAIVNAKGEIVREIDLGKLQKGEQSVRWDGKNGKFQDEPVGEYSYRLSAADENGKGIPIKTDSAGLVTGVSFEAGKSLLLVDGKKIPIESVGRIEGDSPAQATAKPLAPAFGKEKQNMSTKAADTLERTVKNGLPPGLSPEKMRTMLASMEGGAAENAGAEGAAGDEGRGPVDPLWNPDSN